jgi:hypothetical protein
MPRIGGLVSGFDTDPPAVNASLLLMTLGAAHRFRDVRDGAIISVEPRSE